MSHQTAAITRRAKSPGNPARTLIVSVLGLLPVGIVSGFMLMQILGVWPY